jgi:hypothetical protein
VPVAFIRGATIAAYCILTAVRLEYRDAATKLKTTTLTVRVEPTIKEALSTAARSERRSLANMLEVVVLEYCKKRDVKGALSPMPKAKKA